MSDGGCDPLPIRSAGLGIRVPWTHFLVYMTSLHKRVKMTRCLLYHHTIFLIILLLKPILNARTNLG